MEVIVSFIDGDPDRPVVTGAVYNGENPTPGLLPAQATKSILRTRTVPHGTGYNELSFEDAMGIERVHIRAQRDLDELVLNNHQTSVSGSQVNEVGGNQIETVMRHQQLDVDGKRVTALSDHQLNVGGSASMHVVGEHEIIVDQGSSLLEVATGSYVASAKQSITLVQDEGRFVELCTDDDGSRIELHCDGATMEMKRDAIELKVGRSVIRITDGVIQVNNKSFPSS
jgi:hypothetical protein